MTSVVRALKHRNFRLFFFGQGLSLIGTWMQQVAMGWLAYRLTGSPFFLGLMAFAGQFPTFVFAPLAGVLADKRSRLRMLFLTQCLSLVQAAALAALVLTGGATPAWLLFWGLFIGVVNAFDVPARQSFIVETLERPDDLPNALALHSTIFNGARLIGPTVAGFVIAAYGEGVCFLLNALSFVPILAALSAMRLGAKRPARAPASSVWKELVEGFRYAYGLRPVRWALALLAITSVFGMSYAVVLPVVAKEVLHGGPRTLGFLVASTGLGALVGALYLASRRTVTDLPAKIAAACALFSASLALFSLSRSFALSAAILFVAGFGMMVQMVSTNTLLQTLSEDRMRGRVMSFYTMALIGMGPLGGLLAGFAAARIGAPKAIAAGSVVCLVAALVFASRARGREGVPGF